MTAILKITDGTTEINLLGDGIQLASWRPQLAAQKSGGTYVDSQLADGRQLVDVKSMDITDTYSLVISGATQDQAIVKMQSLLRILEQAVNYWVTDYEPNFVWIERKASCETYSTYALIKNYRVVEDENPFAQPFTGEPAIKNNIQLIIEHGPWLESAPGTSECVESGNQSTYLTDTARLGSNMTFESYGGIAPTVYTSWLNDYSAKGMVTNTAAPHGGTGAPELQIQADGAAQYARIYQNMAAAPGNYSLAFWVKSVGAFGAPLFEISVDTYPGGSNLLLVKLDTPIYPVWDLLVYPITIPAGAIGITLSFKISHPGLANNVNLAIDDVGINRVATITQGSPDDCNGTFITNGRYPAAMDTLFVYDASIPLYSTNLLAGAPPYAILPQPCSVGDILYIGSTVGPFNSIIFDISSTVANTIVWEFWNGVAWTVFPPDDRTSSFANTGLLSVTWISLPSWVANVVNGVNAYWVRARMTAVGPQNAPIVQAQPYNIKDPWLEINDDQLEGDISALITQKIYQVSAFIAAGTSRLIFGCRETERGANFLSHINLTNAGAPATGNENKINITIDPLRITGGVADLQAPAGQRLLFTSAIESLNSRVVVQPVYPNDYMGSFRAFLRVYQSNGSANQVFMRLRAEVSSDVIYESPTTYISNTNVFQLIDLGKVTLAPRNIAKNESCGSFRLRLLFGATAAGVLVQIYDLILIPVDEMAGDFYSVVGASINYHLKLDSIEQPKITLRASRHLDADDSYNGTWRVIANGAYQLEPRKELRLYYLAESVISGSINGAYPYNSHKVKSFSQSRYLTMKGNDA